MKDGRLSHIVKNRMDAGCFQHDSAYKKYKDFKIEHNQMLLKNKAHKIAVYPKYNGYERALVSMV